MRLLLLKSFSLDEAPYFGPNDNLFVLLCNRNLSSPFLLLVVVVISSSAAEERGRVRGKDFLSRTEL